MTVGVAARHVRAELNRLVATVDDLTVQKVRLSFSALNATRDAEPSTRAQTFDKEMNSFFHLFTRYLTERADSKEL